MTAFAQQPQDENLVPGWNVQGNFASAATTGTPGQGFAEPGVAGANPGPVPLQGSSGLPYPPNAEDVGSEADGASSKPVLQNPGYASSGINMATTLTAPVPTTTGVQNPYGVQAECIITGQTAATTAAVAPYAASATAATFGANQTVADPGLTTIVVPPAGWIKVASAADVASVVWIPTN